MSSRHKKFLKYSIIAVVVLLVLLFLSRGLIRKHLVPAYVGLSVKKDINQRFDEEFTWINTSLEEKLNLNQPQVLVPNQCRYMSFRGIRATVDCLEIKKATAEYTNDFAAAWKQYAHDFEKSLQAAGWSRSLDIPIQDAFMNEGNYGIFFNKNVGNIRCSLTLGGGDSKASIVENCIRYVKVFGGA